MTLRGRRVKHLFIAKAHCDIDLCWAGGMRCVMGGLGKYNPPKSQTPNHNFDSPRKVTNVVTADDPP